MTGGREGWGKKMSRAQSLCQQEEGQVMMGGEGGAEVKSQRGRVKSGGGKGSKGLSELLREQVFL